MSAPEVAKSVEGWQQMRQLHTEHGKDNSAHRSMAALYHATGKSGDVKKALATAE